MKAYIYAEEAIRLLNSGRPVIVFDVETTGTRPETVDYVIEFSASLFEMGERGYEKKDSIELYICPPNPISAKITEITGITNEFLADKPTEDEQYPLIKAFLMRGSIFAGQNVSFDISFINEMAKRQENAGFKPQFTIDTLSIAHEVIKKRDLTEGSYKLCNLAEYYGVSSGGFHNSTDDIRNTWDVLMCEMRDFCMQDAEQKKEEVITDFYLTRMSRWEMKKGRNNRQERLYCTTSVGEVYFDLISRDVLPKEPDGPKVDPKALVARMTQYARNNGYESFEEFEKGKSKR